MVKCDKEWVLLSSYCEEFNLDGEARKNVLAILGDTENKDSLEQVPDVFKTSLLENQEEISLSNENNVQPEKTLGIIASGLSNLSGDMVVGVTHEIVTASADTIKGIAPDIFKYLTTLGDHFADISTNIIDIATGDRARRDELSFRAFQEQNKAEISRARAQVVSDVVASGIGMIGDVATAGLQTIGNVAVETIHAGAEVISAGFKFGETVVQEMRATERVRIQEKEETKRLLYQEQTKRLVAVLDSMTETYKSKMETYNHLLENYDNFYRPYLQSINDEIKQLQMIQSDSSKSTEERLSCGKMVRQLIRERETVEETYSKTHGKLLVAIQNEELNLQSVNRRILLG